MSRPFTEVRRITQTPGEPHKRWFQSDYFDLFVWHEPDHSLWGFRLCYDRCFDEHALTWHRATGATTHHSVDEGGRDGTVAGTPWLREARHGVPAEVIERFDEQGSTLPDEIRVLVRGVLEVSSVRR